jgi:hypothetical protein
VQRANCSIALCVCPSRKYVRPRSERAWSNPSSEERRLQLHDRLVVSPGVVIDHANVGAEDQRERLDLLRTPHRRKGGLDLPLREQ